MNSKNLLNVFLVDDNPLCTAIYRQHLVNSGVQYISVFEGAEDCIQAINLTPDIVFLDQHLENHTGIDVLKKIKTMNHNIYVVMVSGDDSAEISESALYYGAFDYIVKGETELKRMDHTIDKIMHIRQELADYSY